MIAFDLPPSALNALARSGKDPNQAAREAVLVDLYRRSLLSHGQFAEGLGVSRAQADEVLHRHGVTEDQPTIQEVEEQVAELRRLLG